MAHSTEPVPREDPHEELVPPVEFKLKPAIVAYLSSTPSQLTSCCLNRVAATNQSSLRHVT